MTLLKKPVLQNTLFGLIGLAILSVLVMPNLVFAGTEATQIMNDGFDLAKVFMKALVYIIMATMFVAFMWVLLKSYMDWKDDNKREASAGSILTALVLGLMVMGIVFVVGEKAIKYIDDNVKVTAIETTVPVAVAALDRQSVDSRPVV